MTSRYIDKWDGGYKLRQKDGRLLFVIQREIGGKRFHVSTRAHSETAAYEQLKKFESDPEAYLEQMRNRRVDDGGLQLTAQLILDFQEHLRTRHRPAGQKYIYGTGRYLGQWLKDLGGRDLRKITLAELKDLIRKRETAAQARTVAIKAFCAYLRQERSLLDRRDDATIDLPVPQSIPEKHRRRKVVPHENVQKVLAHLAPALRDRLLVLQHVGWHVSELQRFAAQPDARIVELTEITRAAHRRANPDSDPPLAVLQVRHKSGDTTRTPVSDRAVLDAAYRTRERGAFDHNFLNEAIKSACKVAGVPPFTAGVMRHSCATWAIEAGTPPERVAEFLNHKSKSTTLRFYADVAVPTVDIKRPKGS